MKNYWDTNEHNYNVPHGDAPHSGLLTNYTTTNTAMKNYWDTNEHNYNVPHGDAPHSGLLTNYTSHHPLTYVRS